MNHQRERSGKIKNVLWKGTLQETHFGNPFRQTRQRKIDISTKFFLKKASQEWQTRGGWHLYILFHEFFSHLKILIWERKDTIKERSFKPDISVDWSAASKGRERAICASVRKSKKSQKKMNEIWIEERKWRSEYFEMSKRRWLSKRKSEGSKNAEISNHSMSQFNPRANHHEIKSQGWLAKGIVKIIPSPQ